MSRKTNILTVGLVLIINFFLSNQECIINVNDKKHLTVNSPYPLFLDKNNEFIRASRTRSSYKREIILPESFEMKMACTGYKNYFTVFGPNVSEVIATCVSDQNFKVNGFTLHVRDLNCKSVSKKLYLSWHNGKIISMLTYYESISFRLSRSGHSAHRKRLALALTIIHNWKSDLNWKVRTLCR